MITNNKNNEEYLDFEVNYFKKQIMENTVEDVKIVKIKYKKPLNKMIKIPKIILDKLIIYFKNIKQKDYIDNLRSNFKGIKKIYIQTSELNVLDYFIDNKNVKLIYEISSIENLKK